LKSYQLVECGNDELIEPTEDIDHDVLTAHIGMTALLKNACKRKIDSTKDEDLFV